MITSDSRAIASKWSTANWCSILATTSGGRARPLRQSLSTAMSDGSRTNDNAMKSTPASKPRATSPRSLSVNAGKETRTPGRLMCLRDPRLPSVKTSHATPAVVTSTTRIFMSPLSTTSVSPARTSDTKPS